MAITLWRISNHADLSGRGGMLLPARWHNAGRPVVYLAESSSEPLLEILVYMRVFNTPGNILLHRVEIDGDVNNEDVSEPYLPAGWKADRSITRAIGDSWLAGACFIVVARAVGDRAPCLELSAQSAASCSQQRQHS